VLRSLVEPAQQVLGRRPGAANFAHVVQFLADNVLIEVEKMRALPRLRYGAAKNAMQGCPRDGTPA
jgi:hypothetical protein